MDMQVSLLEYTYKAFENFIFINGNLINMEMAYRKVLTAQQFWSKDTVLGQ